MDDGALNVVDRRRRADRGRERRRARRALPLDFVKDYPDIPQEKARIVLVEASPEIFSMFSENLRTYAVEALEKCGVEVQTGEIVESIAPTRVTLKSGTVITAHTLVWGAGLQGNPLVQSLGLELERGNRIAAEPDLGSRATPRCSSVGDVAAITDAKTKHVLPQLGSVALQSGEHAGENIARLVAGKDTEPFKYHDKGSMATIGRGPPSSRCRAGGR